MDNTDDLGGSDDTVVPTSEPSLGKQNSELSG
jgi:hypothetical protein